MQSQRRCKYEEVIKRTTAFFAIDISEYLPGDWSDMGEEDAFDSDNDGDSDRNCVHNGGDIADVGSEGQYTSEFREVRRQNHLDKTLDTENRTEAEHRLVEFAILA